MGHIVTDSPFFNLVCPPAGFNLAMNRFYLKYLHMFGPQTKEKGKNKQDTF